MRNWLGQDVVPGAVVYRGARDGNTSTYKIGVVESIAGGKARVHWQYEPGRVWRNTGQPGQTRDYVSAVHEMNSKGNPSIDSLILMDEDYLEYCKEVVKLTEDWRTGDMPIAHYKMLVEGFAR